MFWCSKIKEDFKGLVSQLNQDRNFASRSRCSGASLTNFFSCFPRTSPQIRGMICKFLDKSALFKASEQNSLLRKARALLLGRQTGLLINELPAQAAKQVSGDRQNGLKCSTKNPLFQRSFPNEHNRRVAETLREHRTARIAAPHILLHCSPPDQLPYPSGGNQDLQTMEEDYKRCAWSDAPTRRNDRRCRESDVGCLHVPPLLQIADCRQCCLHMLPLLQLTWFQGQKLHLVVTRVNTPAVSFIWRTKIPSLNYREGVKKSQFFKVGFLRPCAKQGI